MPHCSWRNCSLARSRCAPHSTENTQCTVLSLFSLSLSFRAAAQNVSIQIRQWYIAKAADDPAATTERKTSRQMYTRWVGYKHKHTNNKPCYVSSWPTSSCFTHATQCAKKNVCAPPLSEKPISRQHNIRERKRERGSSLIYKSQLVSSLGITVSGWE